MRSIISILLGLSALALAIPAEYETSGLLGRDIPAECTVPEGKGTYQDPAKCKGQSYPVEGQKDLECCVQIEPAFVTRAKPKCTNKVTDDLLFHTSMSAFQKARKAQSPTCDWKSDNCSDSPDKPDGYNFIPSCQRHDFGYQNMRKQKRLTTANRKKIDDNFKKDLYKECSQYSGLSSWKGVECRRIADIYYKAVRACGDGSCGV